MAEAFLRGGRKAKSMVDMPAFLDEDFLLKTETARRLYSEHAASQPVVDYHTHLSAADIASDRRFNNLYEIWLEGDHYKWRAMRACGVAERYCTGNAAPYEKFLAWAKTVPNTLRNPLYQWTHLELRRYFGIEELLNSDTASSIWEQTSGVLQGGLSTREILRRFRVQLVCTTDDPIDDLSAHRAIAGSPFSAAVLVLPTFRPDRALRIDMWQTFLPWLEKLREASNIDVRDLTTFLEALRNRHDYFDEHGCRSSDHGLARCYSKICDEATAAKIFDKSLSAQSITPDELESYGSYLMFFFGGLDADKGWVKQLHLGASRGLSTSANTKPGPDTGFDGIGDEPQSAALARYLDHLQQKNALPRMILYNSNPADNYVFATVATSFHASGDDPVALQHGPAWWFLDQNDGITEQLNTISSVGLLSHFVGMTTDSRSFMSFPRHEYFRRILCDLIGAEVERGELPDDDKLLGGMIEGVCGRNALSYFGLGTDSATKMDTSKNGLTRGV
jgi:glucuronate isomerase